tara:strand:+ start:263 stop:373 length:111 start_codon:yes stop_codon:yes gene_type:complete
MNLKGTAARQKKASRLTKIKEQTSLILLNKLFNKIN